MPLSARVDRVVESYIHHLRIRPLTREILAWELVERDEVIAQLEDVRERRGLALMGALAAGLEGSHDLAAVSAILAGGIHYLLVRARLIVCSTASTCAPTQGGPAWPRPRARWCWCAARRLTTKFLVAHVTMW